MRTDMRAKIINGIVHSRYPDLEDLKGVSMYIFLKRRLQKYGDKTALAVLVALVTVKLIQLTRAVTAVAAGADRRYFFGLKCLLRFGTLCTMCTPSGPMNAVPAATAFPRAHSSGNAPHCQRWLPGGSVVQAVVLVGAVAISVFECSASETTESHRKRSHADDESWLVVENPPATSYTLLVTVFIL
ncbi:hypothetical protein HPB50_016673 [Hyalomma asiaticum]|uniref:Uncharacterized protein n=1 Tax=Hyalomma asiaticum TaxID=266040 RepID=A0ACB7RPJ5_HYAAI|nr:hypothetical protein HPB50_016673 [Hyalomma asiaticum]